MLISDLEELKVVKGWRIEVVFDGRFRSTKGVSQVTKYKIQFRYMISNTVFHANNWVIYKILSAIDHYFVSTSELTIKTIDL